MSDVLHNIGNTPLVRINKISKTAGLKCDLCKYIQSATSKSIYKSDLSEHRQHAPGQDQQDIQDSGP